MTVRCLSYQSCSTSPRCAAETANLPEGRSRHRCQPPGQDQLVFGLDKLCSWSNRSRRAAGRASAAAWLESSNGRDSGVAPGGVPEAATAAGQCSQLETSQAVVCTDFIAETLLPTSSGKYRLRGYRHSVHLPDGSMTVTEPSVIMTGKPEGKENVVVRVHDACFTSEVLGSLKCDCADQLQLAMDYIQEHPGGLIIYLQQEGRGIGLANKIAAYALQEQGLDTVDANRRLGLPDDCREYTSVQNILADLDIKSICLMTNNPRKIEMLEALGVRVTKRIPCIVRAQKHNLGYLSTKRSRMKHMLDREADLNGDFCYWNHEGEPLRSSVFPAEPHHGGTDTYQDAAKPRQSRPLADLVAEQDLKANRRPEVEDVRKSMDEGQ